MATDPTSGVPYIPTQRPEDVGPTSNAIKMQREYAKALMESKYTPPSSKWPYYTWANGLNDMSSKLLGAWNMKEADEREKQQYGGRRDAETPVIGQTGSAASGGSPTAAPFQEAGSGQTSEQSQPSSTKMAALATGGSDTDPVQAAAMRLHKKGETGKDGMAALFNISPDTKGSKSYGPFGLNSRSGSAAELAKEHPELSLTAPPGTPEFDAQWKRAASLNSGADMQKAHEDWHQKHIMSGLPEQMIKAGVDPSIANDPRVKTYMADRKVQMGGAGLNAALLSGRFSSSPEEFIHRISAADKQRIPSNFASYLQGHPNDVRGLSNRIDLRHNTALSGADPDLTAAMVDHHVTKNAVGAQLAQNGPPTALGSRSSSPTYPRIDYTGAPASPPGTMPQRMPPPASVPGLSVQGVPSQTLPQGVIQSELAKAYRGMISAGASPEEAAAQAERLLGLRGKVMPQYEVDEYGRAIQKTPGEIPRVMPGVQPGYFGSFKEEPDMGGAGIRTTIETDPKTGKQYLKRQYEVPQPPSPPGPSSSVLPPIKPPTATPPIAGPAGAIATAPPVAPVAPSGAPIAPPTAAGGILATAPPGTPTAVADDGSPIEAAKGKLAMAGMVPQELLAEVSNQALNKPSKLDALAQTEKAPDLEKPVTPDEKGAKEALDWAEAHPTASQRMPPIVGDALRSGSIDELANIKSNRTVNEKTLEDAIKEEKKEYGKLQTSFRDASTQGVKLRPGLKTAISLLDSPDFQSGPGNEIVGLGRGIREELGQLAAGWAADAVKRGEDPGIYKTIADWAKDPENRTATANQIYQKILQGTILQSLRGMLGPNAGQFRVQELKMLEQAFGNPNLTLPANKAVMSMVDKTNDRNILLGQMASEYARKHHGLDPSFEQAVTRFELEHPPYSPKDYAETLRLVNSSAPPPPAAPGAVGTPPPGGWKTLEGGTRMRVKPQ